MDNECEALEIEEKIRDLQLQLTKVKGKKSVPINTVQEDYLDDTTEETVLACMSGFSQEEPAWFLDSGASSHVTGTKAYLSAHAPAQITSIKTTSGQSLPVHSQGTASIEQSSGEIKHIEHILYVPGVKSNLLSVGKLADFGHLILFDSDKCSIFEKGSNSLYLQGIRDPRSKLYRVQGKTLPYVPTNSSTTTHSDNFFLSKSSSPIIHLQLDTLCYTKYPKTRYPLQTSTYGTNKLPISTTRVYIT